MSGNDSPIGVFDSGIGGLTVVRELMTVLPSERIVYFGDTARVPYGSKSPTVVREYARQDAEVLTSKGAKTIVVACNTASAEALELLQENFNVPVIGVIAPGAKAAVAETRSGRIGIIGTHGTIASQAYEDEIRAIDPTMTVAATACPLFVPLVEEGWHDRSITAEIAREYLEPLLGLEIDTLILGCTHYPVLKQVLQQIVGDSVTLIDSAEATSIEAKNVLETHGLLSEGEPAGEYEFYVSDLPFRFREMGERFLGREMPDVVVVSPEAVQEEFGF